MLPELAAGQRIHRLRSVDIDVSAGIEDPAVVGFPYRAASGHTRAGGSEMSLDDALVLLAETPAGDAAERLALVPESSKVVVRQAHAGETLWYVFDAGDVLVHLWRTDPATPVVDALGLHEWMATASVEVDDIVDSNVSGRPLVQGDQLVGVFTDALERGSRPGTRGSGAPAADGPLDRLPELAKEEPPATRGGGDLVAYPVLDAPASAQVSVAFALSVALSADPHTAAPGTTPITLRDAPEAVVFVVQVMGHGFQFPGGVRRSLEVQLGRPDLTQVRFEVVADPIPLREPEVRRVLEVSFEHAGSVCGRAWREVVIGADVEPAVGALSSVGGTGVTAPPVDGAPHLTVEIGSRQGDSVLEWIFHSRYPDVDLPRNQVVTALRQHDAKSYAIRLMTELPAAQGSALLDQVVTGIGREVAAATPPELWILVNQVWARAQAAGEVPTLLLITAESYIPWELAGVDEDLVDPVRLEPGDAEGLPRLWGARWCIGRWIPPVARTPRGGNRPPLPPQTRIDVDNMAVVIGDYASNGNIRPLPYAIEEGEEIARRYDAVRLIAAEADVGNLLDSRLQRHGQPVQPRIVHFACHGEIDLQNPAYSGIILNDSELRLSPTAMRGSKLGRIAQPLIFLNACQVGTAGSVLSTYGGFAGAFLPEGCRAFIAPLWNVNDVQACAIALSFYAQTLEQGWPVAESLRIMRASWAAGEDGTATLLAYVFYGHPALRLHRAA